MGDVDSLRVGFVGLGNIADLHADNVRAIGAAVAAGVDVSDEARTAFATEYDADVFETADPMYDDVDAVVVTTPNKFHEEYVVGALTAGCDVLVEKPLAHTLDSARTIADAATSADGFCMVGFHNRFRGPVQVLEAYRDAGRFGRPVHVETDYVRRRGVPGRGSWFTSKAVAGGGAIVDIGTHAIDLTLDLLEFPDVTDVTATTRSTFGTDPEYGYLSMWGEDGGSDGVDVEDSASVFLRLASGVTVTLEVAWAANRPSSREFVLRGEDAGATLDLASDELTVHETGRAGVDHHRDVAVDTAASDPHRAEQECFLEAVADGTAPDTNTVAEALEVQAVMDAIYRSAEREETVTLD